ncbi:MAG: trypsin-like peptidase domain-containing protein [Caldisericia bacterium]|nr:trypsin-like peptidase domain-containing protein [Caldisericia bacterium]
MFDESENTVVESTATESMNYENHTDFSMDSKTPRSREVRSGVTWGGVVIVALIFSLIFGAGGGIAGYFLGRQGSDSGSVIINQPTPAITVDDKQIYSGVVDTVNKVSPAVVSITVKDKVQVQTSNPLDDFFGGNGSIFGNPFGYGNPNSRGHQNEQPTYRFAQSAGSGVIIKTDWTTGLKNANTTEGQSTSIDGSIILTNNHVVSGQNPEIYVTLTDKRKLQAKVIASDPISDLAILKVSEKNLPSAELGDSKLLKVGEPVVAIGNPFQFSNTVTTGVISALERNIDTSQSSSGQQTGSQKPTMVGIIQTDAAINPGNSGGPLVTLDGKIVGINTMIYADAQNLGFAVSSNTVKRVVGELLKYGKVLWPYLGISGMDMSSDIAKELGISNIEGAYVYKVNNGPARKAGLFANDIITSIDDKKVTSFEQLLMEVRNHQVGDEVTLTVNRGGKELKLKVTLAELPEMISSND